MTAIAFSQFRKHLSDIVQETLETREPVHVTRAAGEGVVVIPENEWAALMETMHVTSTPANVGRLKAAHDEIEAEIARRTAA